MFEVTWVSDQSPLIRCASVGSVAALHLPSSISFYLLPPTVPWNATSSVEPATLVLLAVSRGYLYTRGLLHTHVSNITA